MDIYIENDASETGIRAAKTGAELIKSAISKQGFTNIILATGASQFDMLNALIDDSDIDWSKCTAFHLDEYIDLSSEHPASFVNYLQTRFVNKVPKLKHFEAINGLEDTETELKRLNAIISQQEIDVAFIGIGENGHLAFNDPPADFETKQPYIKVELDSECRNQQVSEGWFPAIDDVPSHAISMSIKEILRAKFIICTCPDERKARAVKESVEGEISNMCPASILRKTQDKVHLYLDKGSASLLSEKSNDQFR